MNIRKIKTLKYFKTCLIDPYLEVFEILNDSTHTQHENLLEDLNLIDRSVLSEFVREHKYVNALVNSVENKDQEIRAYCLANILHKEIVKERIAALCDKSLRPKPYNSENLKEVRIDSNKLVSVEEFSIYNFGYQYNDFVYSLTPLVVSKINSSYWISRTIIKLVKENGLNFKIRLDPFIEKRKSDYRLMFQKMLIYGRPLDWERLKRLERDEHGRWLNERKDSETRFTEYVWRPGGGEIHFTCEELPKIDCIEYRGSRFLHAIFDKISGNIKHLDGAIRFYTLEEYRERIKYHVRNPQVRKIGNRIKIFQTNDTISQDVFTTLTSQFFVWNDDVQKYFSGN